MKSFKIKYVMRIVRIGVRFSYLVLCIDKVTARQVLNSSKTLYLATQRSATIKMGTKKCDA